MKRRRHILCLILVALLLAALLSGCANSSDTSKTAEKPELRVLIIPKFEIDEMSGDFPGEAQLFYEGYCAGCEETTIPNMPPTGHFYFNEENGVGILVTGSGKTAAGLSVMALLSSGLYDYSDVYVVSVGCGGGNIYYTALGDVILVTSACDYDLGHHVDTHEREQSETRVMWFGDDSYADYEYKVMNWALYEPAFELIKDCPLQTTDQALQVMIEDFPARSPDDLYPTVMKGTALSGDNYWKGMYGHDTATFIAEYYGAPDPYMVTEMEEVAVANALDCFDLRFRMISLRVIVNMDVFMDGETPESTWGEYTSFNEKVENENTETLDIFEPAMHNLFDTGSIVIDALLEGKLQLPDETAEQE